MLTTFALFALASGAAPLAASAASAPPALIALPPLRANGAAIGAPVAPANLALRSPWLEASAHLPSGFALGARQQGAGSAGAPHATSGGDGSAAAQPPSAATSEGSSAGSASGNGTEGEPDIALLRQRERLTRIHRILGISTEASLVVTEVLGTLLAINQQTWFGHGNCFPTGDGIFGTWGCAGGLVNLHEVFAFSTVGLYAATGIFALSMPDPEHASRGNDARAQRLRIHKALAWVHLTGMIVEPILGILSFDPFLFGISSTGEQFGAQSTLRTVHAGVGYITLAALTTAMILELVQ